MVPASELSAKDLRASSYVANPKKLARAAVEQRSFEFGCVLNNGSRAGKRLIELVEQAIREGMEKG